MSQVPRFCSIREPVLGIRILRGGPPTFQMLREPEDLFRILRKRSRSPDVCTYFEIASCILSSLSRRVGNAPLGAFIPF